MVECDFVFGVGSCVWNVAFAGLGAFGIVVFAVKFSAFRCVLSCFLRVWRGV
jgi:hypothetical protein